MTPASYFQAILGCEPTVAKLAIPSPFPQRNLKVFIANRISTTYARREQGVDGIVELVRIFTRAKQGNYLCFFPSYEYMHMVVDRFEAPVADVLVLVQAREMDDAERARFLDAFSVA